MLRKKQKSGGRWLIIEQKIMLQFRYIFSRLSIKIRKEAFSYFPRVWRMKKWTKVMMKWSLLKEIFNNIGKTFISSFSFFFFYVLHSKSWLSPKEYVFRITRIHVFLYESENLRLRLCCSKLPTQFSKNILSSPRKL